MKLKNMGSVACVLVLLLSVQLGGCAVAPEGMGAAEQKALETAGTVSLSEATAEETEGPIEDEGTEAVDAFDESDPDVDVQPSGFGCPHNEDKCHKHCVSILEPKTGLPRYANGRCGGFGWLTCQCKR